MPSICRCRPLRRRPTQHHQPEALHELGMALDWDELAGECRQRGGERERLLDRERLAKEILSNVVDRAG
jgi:hypothetical protein